MKGTKWQELFEDVIIYLQTELLCSRLTPLAAILNKLRKAFKSNCLVVSLSLFFTLIHPLRTTAVSFISGTTFERFHNVLPFSSCVCCIIRSTLLYYSDSQAFLPHVPLSPQALFPPPSTKLPLTTTPFPRLSDSKEMHCSF